jgi:hypothetical protein
MNYIKDWRLFNQKNLLNAKEYVKSNFLRLVKLFKLENYTYEDKENILIEYFTKYPEQIKNISVTTVGNPNQLAIPTLNNIGGTVKYR